MKLKYFVGIVVVVILGAGTFGLYKACKSDKPAPQPDYDKLRPPHHGPPQELPPDAAPPEPTSTELAARPYDAEVLAWQTKSISGDKQKDVSKGKPYKINVYKDAGKKTVNRAKVDANRNDKFEDKYTFEGDKITLQRAPADDEKYTETYHWSGSAWRPEGAAVAPSPTPASPTPASPTPASPTPAPAPTPKPAAGDLPARPYDADVLAWKDRTIGSDKEKDVSKNQSYKLNVYKDAGSTNVNRAKVDLDRDDKFDEKYTFEGAKITLQRAPADDEKYTETYQWTGTAWRRK